MKDEASARALAEALVRVGTRAGKKVVALLTDMEAPLGRRRGQRDRDARGARRAASAGAPRTSSSARCALGAEMLASAARRGRDEEARAQLRDGHRERRRGADGGADDRGAGRRPARRREPVAARGGGGRGRRRGAARRVRWRASTRSRSGSPRWRWAPGRTRADQKVDPAVGISSRRSRGTPSRGASRWRASACVAGRTRVRRSSACSPRSSWATRRRPDVRSSSSASPRTRPLRQLPGRFGG